MPGAAQPTVVFIHGAWMTPRCWKPFIGRFEAAGFQCLAPPWPYYERAIPELRRSPDPRLGDVGVREIVDHYADIIGALPRPTTRYT